MPKKKYKGWDYSELMKPLGIEMEEGRDEHEVIAEAIGQPHDFKKKKVMKINREICMFLIAYINRVKKLEKKFGKGFEYDTRVLAESLLRLADPYTRQYVFTRICGIFWI